MNCYSPKKISPTKSSLSSVGLLSLSEGSHSHSSQSSSFTSLVGNHSRSSSILSSPSSSNVSLPSFLSETKIERDYFNTPDFAGSIPMSHGSKISLFGDTIPLYRRFNVLSTPRINTLHDDIKDSVEENEIKSKRDTLGLNKSESKHDSGESMLGDEYEFNRTTKTVYVPRRRGGLAFAKKMSKHSTITRKLKPQSKTKKKIKEFTKIPGPLPRVLQRAKMRREMAALVAAVKVGKETGQLIKIKKETLNLKSAVRHVINSLQLEVDGSNYWDKYVGPNAQVNFYKQYKEAGRRHVSYLESAWPEEFVKSPRSRYMKEIVTNNMTPLPILLRKETKSKGIFLGHMGLGDKKILPVIHVLEDLPTVETIDLCDNRLTDESLMPLSLKLSKLKNLTSLNLSDNKIDDSSQVIMDYLRSKECKLTSLWLDAADIDDQECGNLARAIRENQSIEFLSLRNNMIGKDELLNVVYPDLETGGEALGDMLCDNDTITELDVSWNFIRLDSACQFADSLLLNTTLVTLKLAYNAFGEVPTQYLGKALKENKTLEYLDLQYNSITPRATAVLANALLHNDTLETLILDGNVLGDVGAQAVVAAIQRSSNIQRTLNISFSNCDCKQHCPDVFNAANPSGTYTLDLSEPYGQMVCEEIIYLANYRAGCAVNDIKYKAAGDSKFKTISLVRPLPETVVQQKICIEMQKDFAKLILDIVEKKKKQKSRREGSSNLIKRTDSKKVTRAQLRKEDRTTSDSSAIEKEDDTEKAITLCKNILEHFDLFPDDSVHKNVVNELIASVEEKLKYCPSVVEFKEDFTVSVLYHIFFAIFELNDTDKSGDMDIEEFLNCIYCLGVEFDHKYGKKLLHDFDIDKSGFIDSQEFAMIMANEFCRLDIRQDELVNAATKKPWVIPISGELIVEVFYQCEMPNVYDVSHDEGIMGVIQCIREVKTDEQRETVFLNATTSPYFYMSAQQALMLFEEMGKHDESRLDVLAMVLPQLVSPEQCHRFIDSVLDEEGKFALRIKMGQSYNVFMGLYCGHYCYDLKHVQKQQEGRSLSAVWSEEMKYMKKHGCDTSQRGNYSNFRNETYCGIPMSITSSWFAACPTSGKLRLDYVSTIRPKQGNWPLSNKRFESFKSMLDLDSIMDVRRSTNLKRNSTHRSIFSTNSRASTPSGAEDKNEMLTDLDLDISKELGQSGSTTVDDSALTLGAIKEVYFEYMESCHHYHSIYPVERQRDISRPDYDPNARPVTPEMLRDIERKPSLSKYDKIFPYAYMKLLRLQLALPAIFLSVDQVIDIVLKFPDVNYLRVQAFVSMFSRIVDYDKNGVRILDVLSRDDQSELLHRIGILNLIDPLSPDRLYRLDLRRWDHREACKLFIQLAIIEPGENWEGEEYRWSKYDTIVPGWSLPAPWTEPDETNHGDGGPRRHGWVSFVYTSTAPGCSPNWQLRRDLRKNVLSGIKRNA